MKNKVFDYFLEGVKLMIALYEICRTGRKHKR